MAELATIRTRPFTDGRPSRARDDIAGSVADFVSLAEELEELVVASEPVFRDDRRAHLAELQARLRRLPRRLP